MKRVFSTEALCSVTHKPANPRQNAGLLPSSCVFTQQEPFWEPWCSCWCLYRGHWRSSFYVCPIHCPSLHRQVYSRPSSLVSSSPQRSTSSEADGERQFNLNGNSVPTATQTLMTMYRRRSPEEFNPKLVGASCLCLKLFYIRAITFKNICNLSKLINISVKKHFPRSTADFYLNLSFDCRTASSEKEMSCRVTGDICFLSRLECLSQPTNKYVISQPMFKKRQLTFTRRCTHKAIKTIRILLTCFT